MSDRQPRKTTQKVLLSITALAAAAGLAGVGTYASFTGSVGATQNVSSAKMQLTLGAPATSANRLSVSATGMVPGDSMRRAVDLITPATNTTGTLTGVELTTTDSTPTVLSTDVVKGLFIKIDRCSVAWTETPVGAGFTYTCGGVSSVVLARVPVVGANRTLNSLTLTPGQTNNLVVTIDLDATANDTFQGLSATIQHTFAGVQRAPNAVQ
jgi:spore coat-associated protein N